MRLINTATLHMHDFPNEVGIRYAILSHRWEEEEVTLQQFEASHVVTRRKRGYTKIVNCCKEARKRGFQYVWIDTCCIDRTSSAELSEAINSMYRWYSEAEECYAFLSDVQDSPGELAHSVWFKRGWTLQELLAPTSFWFYNRSWQCIGSRFHRAQEVSTITGIPHKAFGFPPEEFAIAEKMSWAATRSTTRMEDRAYSLMGLFRVNMTMLYGEAERAFLRLQEEIIRYSDDQSIFAWTGVGQEGSGLLATSPWQFAWASTQKIRQEDLFSDPSASSSYSMTNRGLAIRLRLMPWSPEIYAAILQCQSSERSCPAIFLQKTVKSQGEFRRICTADHGDLLMMNAEDLSRAKTRLSLVHVRQDELSTNIGYLLPATQMPIHGVQIDQVWPPSMTYKIRTEGHWHADTETVIFPSGTSINPVRIDLSSQKYGLRRISMGFDFDFKLRCLLSSRRTTPQTSSQPTEQSSGSDEESSNNLIDHSEGDDTTSTCNNSTVRDDQLLPTDEDEDGSPLVEDLEFVSETEDDGWPAPLTEECTESISLKPRDETEDFCEVWALQLPEIREGDPVLNVVLLSRNTEGGVHIPIARIIFEKAWMGVRPVWRFKLRDP